MTKQAQLTRTCLACGLEKPLAAFLQITGTQGTHYGNICSTCRSDSAKGKKVLPERTEDDISRGSSGIKIGAKERLEKEVQQKTEAKQAQEIHYDELEKREKLALDKIDLLEKKQKAEKDHRKTYLDEKKKQGFLKYKTTQQTGLRTRTETPTAQNIDQGMSVEQRARDSQNLEKTIEQEARLSTIDTSQLYLDSQFGELKFQSVIFRQFKEWLGEGANFRVMERLMKGKTDNKTKTPSKEIKTASDAFIEFEKKHSKPTGRR